MFKRLLNQIINQLFTLIKVQIKKRTRKINQREVKVKNQIVIKHRKEKPMFCLMLLQFLR